MTRPIFRYGLPLSACNLSRLDPRDGTVVKATIAQHPYSADATVILTRMRDAGAAQELERFKHAPSGASEAAREAMAKHLPLVNKRGRWGRPIATPESATPESATPESATPESATASA